MSKHRELIVCTPVRLTDEMLLSAANEAIRENPANRPHGTDDPQRIGVLTSKYWGAKGVELSVAFLEQIPSDTAARILAHMNAWKTEAGANVTFRLSGSPQSADVRITRSGDGYWSYLGTDVRGISPGQPTMSLQGFTMRTSESEYRRVVRHETGHTLGFPHEHMRRDLVALLDPEKTIAWFRRNQGWDRQTTIEQVLTPIEESSLVDPTRADGTSIMCYQLPGACTRSGQPIPGGNDLDDLDRSYAAKVYPTAAPPPPPGEVLYRRVDGADGSVAFTPVKESGR